MTKTLLIGADLKRTVTVVIPDACRMCDPLGIIAMNAYRMCEPLRILSYFKIIIQVQLSLTAVRFK